MPLVQEQTTGPDYLASSHFEISQDTNIVMKDQRSTFINDYPPWPIDAKPQPAIPPRPAGVLNEDHGYYKHFLSETKKAYDEKQLPPREAGADPDKLRATNFKMDGDMRLKTFDTTQKVDYTPKKGDGKIYALTREENPRKSNIPQGDREKADMPITDYRARYIEHDMALHAPKKAENKHQGQLSTIKGDQRQHQYRTTHKDVYHPLALPQIKPCPNQRGSSLPQGDPEKERTFKSIFQESYITHDLSKLPPSEVDTQKLQASHVNIPENRLNNYLSTFKDAYRPVLQDAELRGPLRDRNESNFPRGDIDAYRNAERSNVTTNRFYQQQMKPTERPVIISGANRRTKSNVEFGEPDKMDKFYETTTKSTYVPTSVPYKNQRYNMNESHIPIDYFNDVNHTTYRADYIPQEDGFLKINEDGLERLKQSHIEAPWKAQRFFSTEHKDQFFQKDMTSRGTYDPGRLQKSSVPLGTLNR